MAKLTSEITFTGSMGDLSAYRMRGVDGIIVRMKGGASKEKIKKSPAFARTRLINAEFGGRSKASKLIMQAIWPQKAMADFNIAGPLNALMKPIQTLDKNSPLGTRSIQLSKNPRILDSFSFNRKMQFESLVRTSLSYSLSRESQSARIDIPALVPGINLYTHQQSPMFRLVAVLGLVPDLFYSELPGMGYTHAAGYDRLNNCKTVTTEWCSLIKGSPATTLELSFPSTPPDEHYTLVLSIGICFGTMIDAATVQQVKYVGAAKVMGVI